MVDIMIFEWRISIAEINAMTLSQISLWFERGASFHNERKSLIQSKSKQQ